MRRERVSLQTVDLGNCHKESIHVPGWVQPHGALLAPGPNGANAGQLLTEVERHATRASELASFAVKAHRSMLRMKGRPDIASVLNEAVVAIRRFTGIDRVKAYRFHADERGEIVAEAELDVIEPDLGQRLPAYDIPVQARRLYAINTLRLIADVHDEQVPIDALDPAAPPLDLSSSNLFAASRRSTSSA